MARVYSVQSAQDAARLAAGGLPWPPGLQRANLGIGFYAWDSFETAEHYRSRLQRHGATDLQIVVYEMSAGDLLKLKMMDLRQLPDEEVNAWMDKYSQYGGAEPHDWEYIIRYTDLGAEHYFAAAIFAKLRKVT
jgi:hypothetical protein